jgi:hypothetical protein
MKTHIINLLLVLLFVAMIFGGVMVKDYRLQKTNEKINNQTYNLK